MNQLFAEKFLQALTLCKKLPAIKDKHTPITFDAIVLFCEVAADPSDFLQLRQQYAAEIEAALAGVDEYGSNADNWRVDCELGFGVKDHCNILSFFLNVPTGIFTRYSGNLKTPEIICELIADWKGIDLTPLIENRKKVPVA